MSRAAVEEDRVAKRHLESRGEMDEEERVETQKKLWSDNINDDTTRPDHGGQNPQAELRYTEKGGSRKEKKMRAPNTNGKPKVLLLLYRP